MYQYFLFGLALFSIASPARRRRVTGAEQRVEHARASPGLLAETSLHRR
jgi:hypothetical protein